VGRGLFGPLGDRGLPEGGGGVGFCVASLRLLPRLLGGGGSQGGGGLLLRESRIPFRNINHIRMEYWMR